MDIRFPATVEEQSDGTFLVQFVDLPDTFTEGQTKEEALFNSVEVLSAMLAWKLALRPKRLTLMVPSAVSRRYLSPRTTNP